MSEPQQIIPSPSLVAENAAIFERFASDGVDLSQKLQFEFAVEFASKQDAEEFGSRVRTAMPAIASEYGLSNHRIGVRSDEEDDLYELVCLVEMVPEVRAVSGIEQSFGALAEELGGSECFWEFADPANKEIPGGSVQEAQK